MILVDSIIYFFSRGDLLLDRRFASNLRVNLVLLAKVITLDSVRK